MTEGQAQNVDVGLTLADLLCLETPTQNEESRRGYLSDRVVKGAAALVDESGILQQLEQWYREDHPNADTEGGAPVQGFTVRAVLIVLVALVRSGESPLVSRVAEVLRLRLHTPMRDLLGLQRANWSNAQKDMIYHRAYRRLHWLLDLIDPYPGGERRRRPTRAEREAWLASLDRDLVEHRLHRLHTATNMLVESSVRLLPTAAFQAWQGNMCIDATLVRAWGKRGHPKAKHGRDNSADRMSPEGIAGWYVRTNPQNGKSEREFGYEAHLAVMTENLQGEGSTIFPRLVLAMTFDRPAQNPGGNATMLLKTLHDRGYPAGILASDRAYVPGCKPENLQLPARAYGFRIACDYRDDQLGIQAEYGGAILVEGTWYCPSMPQPLINASIDRRADTITEKVYQARIQQRARYAFRRKQAPRPEGNTVFMCPARGPGATASCRLADTGTTVNLGMPTRLGLTPVRRPPEHPDICCTNRSSITIPIAPTSDGNANIAKYAQDFPYQSDEWKAAYRPARSTIEGFNGYVKSPTEEDLEEPARRRIRGYAFQAFAAALMILASNIRKIDSWIRTRDTKPTPTPARARRRNASPDLADHLPPENGPPLAIPA
jgi:hypothetical protein